MANSGTPTELFEGNFLTSLCFFLAGAALLAGLGLGFKYWPPTYLDGRPTLSITWLITGVMGAVFLAAAGQVLTLLERIERNTREPRS